MTKVAVDPRTMRVAIGMPFGYHSIPWQTALSLMDTVKVATQHGLSVSVLAPVNTYITHARSLVAKLFLDSDATHLFWIDSDMTWQPRDFLRMLALGGQMPVVGATYAVKRDPLMYIVPGLGGEFNEFGCLPHRGMGLGFTCVQREVIEKLAAKVGTVRLSAEGIEAPDMFRFDVIDGHVRGEDITFFADCIDLGYQPWLDPRTNVGHAGLKVYGGDVARELGIIYPGNAAPQLDDPDFLERARAAGM